MPVRDIKKYRLNLFISKYASYSRRQADRLIQNKQVRVNGQVVFQPAFFVTRKDSVKVKDKKINPVDQMMYIVFHKPEKTLVTASDPKGRTTVFHYFKKMRQRIFAVGRLDWNTEGLLLLTNDGLFSQKIQDPKNKIPKTYMVKLNHPLRKNHVEKLKTGVTIPGGRVKALNVHIRPKSWVRISIQEGKNRQLHFMFQKLGFQIRKLKRIQVGGLKLGALKKGQARFLEPKDLRKIFQKKDKLHFKS